MVLSSSPVAVTSFSCGLKRHQVSFLLDLYRINDDSGLKFKQTKNYSKTKQNKKLTFPLNIKFLAATRSVLQKRYSQKCYRTPVLELLLNKKTSAQVLSCEFSEIFNIFLQTTSRWPHPAFSSKTRLTGMYFKW